MNLTSQIHILQMITAMKSTVLVASCTLLADCTFLHIIQLYNRRCSERSENTKLVTTELSSW